MRVFVLGGSNSIKREGWVAQFGNALPDVQIVNLGVGAANSLMGYFRLSALPDAGLGDVVLWEYALNDENQIEVDKPLDVAKALKYVELTIRLAMERQMRFLPVIFRPRRYARKAVVSVYRPALMDLFSRYGITPVDPYALYAEANGGAEVPLDDYADRVHLREDGVVMHLAAQGCAARLRSQEGLAMAMPAQPGPGTVDTVRAVTQFVGTEPVVFENSLMRQLVWQPGPRSMVIYRPDVGRWRIVAVLTIAAKEPAQFGLRIGEVVLPLSASHKSREFSKPLMRMLDMTARRPLVTGPNRPLELLGWEEPDPRLPTGTVLGPLTGQTGLTGLLLERVTGQP